MKIIMTEPLNIFNLSWWLVNFYERKKESVRSNLYTKFYTDFKINDIIINRKEGNEEGLLVIQFV